MKHAQYGRMKLGRCITIDIGYLGCSADVLSLMDSRCSGRQTCQIHMGDPILFDASRCPKDLKPYMEASYDCVKGKPYISITFRFFRYCGSYTLEIFIHEIQ